MKQRWVSPTAGLLVITLHTKYTSVPSNIVPKVEKRWQVKGKDVQCEVGKAQRPNTWKEEEEEDYDDDDDDDGGGDDVLQYSTNMKLPFKFNAQQFFHIFTILFTHLSETFADLRHTH